VNPDEEPGEPFWEDEDDEPVVEPRSRWRLAAEILGGLFALLLVTLGVMAFYLAGGVFLGLLETAAPAILAMMAAVWLARYLSRRSSNQNSRTPRA
jgi:hypothetical protein